MSDKKIPVYYVGAAAVAVLAVGIWMLTSGGNDPVSIGETRIDAPDMAQAAEHGEPREDLFIGDADAPVEVIEYASFTCPHCARFHEDVYPQLKTNFIDTGKVKFVFREIYFDKFGLWAGLLARCGGDDRYFGIVDLLMEKQSEWARGGSDREIVDNMFRVGRLAGMTDDQMNVCVRDNDLAEALVADFQLKAGQDEVTSTPTFIVDGEKMSNMSWADFEAVLNERLN